ncbi:MAG TPA: hypothetical protein VKR54_05090 [Candidatus Babeliales bacterium]|jgi:hypothetical protein|nr:hypothetical protein [Candidatus Babeliales bacterium]
MNSRLIFTLTFFAIVTQLSTSQILLADIELFSLSYDDDGLKVNTLHNTIYDEEIIKRDIQKTKDNEEKTQQNEQEKEKKNIILKEILLKKQAAEEDLKRKQLALQKTLL